MRRKVLSMAKLITPSLRDLKKGLPMVPERHIWGFLNPVFNRYDSDRVKEVGGDKACAEWLLRNGGSVKYENSDRFVKDYNSIGVAGGNRHIVEVNATDASISMSGGGFKYFEHTKHIRKVSFHKCNYMRDDALYHLVVLAESLKDLEIVSCPNVSDDGVLALSNMFGLQRLHLADMIGVKDRDKCVSVLKNYLPKCNIEFRK